MRLDSCKKCGKEMTVSETCNTCQNPIIFECKNCGILTEEQTHLKCYFMSLYYQLLKARPKQKKS